LPSPQNEFEQIYPAAGWVEHDPMAILYSQLHSVTGALASGKIKSDEVAAIGITNQRETTILWDKNTGKPVYNAIVWQCRRTAPLCEELKKQGLEKYVTEKNRLAH
jgi:glycerol kinase